MKNKKRHICRKLSNFILQCRLEIYRKPGTFSPVLGQTTARASPHLRPFGAVVTDSYTMCCVRLESFLAHGTSPCCGTSRRWNITHVPQTWHVQPCSGTKHGTGKVTYQTICRCFRRVSPCCGTSHMSHNITHSERGAGSFTVMALTTGFILQKEEHVEQQDHY